MLNEPQAGAAIEGELRQEQVEMTQFAMDTNGYIDFAMALDRLLCLLLCLRLEAACRCPRTLVRCAWRASRQR